MRLRATQPRIIDDQYTHPENPTGLLIRAAASTARNVTLAPESQSDELPGKEIGVQFQFRFPDDAVAPFGIRASKAALGPIPLASWTPTPMPDPNAELLRRGLRQSFPERGGSSDAGSVDRRRAAPGCTKDTAAPVNEGGRGAEV